MEQAVRATEIAKLLGCSVRSVQLKANNEHWPCIEVAGRGGIRKEYSVVHLPANIQKALAKHEAAEAKKNLPARRGETLPAVVQSVGALKGWTDGLLRWLDWFGLALQAAPWLVVRAST